MIKLKCSRIKWSLLALLALPTLALAAPTGSLPWDGPLQRIADSISGPVAMALGVIAVVIAGLAIAFGESGSGVRRLMQVLFGLAIAFTAASLIATLFHPGMGASV